MNLLQNSAQWISFVLIDLTGIEVAGLGVNWDVYISKGSGAFAAGLGAKAEIGNGWYAYQLTAAETDTEGNLSVMIDPVNPLAIQQNLVYRVAPPAGESVWTYASRTLTNAVQVTSTTARGTDIELLRGDTFTLALLYLGSLGARTKLWFTIKEDKDYADTLALVQIEESAGLVTINRAAAGVPANGAITVTDPASGALTITLAAEETAKLPLIGAFFYDIQMLVGSTVTTLLRGRARVIGDITRATS